MSSLEGKEDIVKESLAIFMHKHTGDAYLETHEISSFSERHLVSKFVNNCITLYQKMWVMIKYFNSGIDDIVLSYVVSILEDVGNSQRCEESLEVEQFTEMMSAYLPRFTEIDGSHVCDWMLNLAAEISESREEKGATITDFNECGLLKRKHTSHSTSSTEDNSDTNSCREDASNSLEDPFLDPQMQILQEMFPNACSMEVRHCLCIANGDTDKATQLIIHRQENGQNISSPASLQSVTARMKSRNCSILDDKQLKENILSRYAFVDKADDEREHRPVAPKVEPKKLVRYRDNQVVSIKGEKYTEVKADETDDMKKTYVSLKPARNYRFH